MIHRLQYRYLNNYLTVYFKHIQIRSFYRTKTIHKQKMDAIEVTKTKVKLIGAMA